MKCIQSGKKNIHGDHLSSEPGPAATMVGNIVMGTRIGGAAGREIADIEEDSDMARKVVTQIQYCGVSENNHTLPTEGYLV